MPRYNRAHYFRIGQDLYNDVGLVILFGSPQSWQSRAKQEGYRQAREDWRTKNPNADELAEASARNRRFCLRALGKTTP